MLKTQKEKKLENNFSNNNKTQKKKILLAPTWGTDFFDLNTHLSLD